MRVRFLLSVALQVLFVSGSGVVQAAPTPSLPECRVPFRTGAIVVDGKIEDDGWKEAERIRIDQPPLRETGKNRESVPFTEVWLTYDESALYVAFVCCDRDICPVGTMRDDPLHTGDVVEFFWDGAGDHRRILEFQFNPAGAIRDVEYLFSGKEPHFNEDGLWVEMKSVRENPGVDLTGIRHAAATFRGRDGRPAGWLVEIAFPLKELGKEVIRKGNENGGNAAVNFVRYDYSTGIAAPVMRFWSPTVAGRPHRSPGRMGRLVFLPKQNEK